MWKVVFQHLVLSIDWWYYFSGKSYWHQVIEPASTAPCKSGLRATELKKEWRLGSDI